MRRVRLLHPSPPFAPVACPYVYSPVRFVGPHRLFIHAVIHAVR